MTLHVQSVFTIERKQARTKKSRDRCPKSKQSTGISKRQSNI